MSADHRRELDILLVEYERLTGLDLHVDPAELVRRTLAKNVIACRGMDLLLEVHRPGEIAPSDKYQ